MTREEHGQEVNMALSENIDRETVGAVVAALDGREVPPGGIIELSRRAARAFPGRVDASRWSTLVDNVEHWAGKYKKLPPPPPPAPPSSMPPGMVRGLGFGRASEQANRH
jgi:hypothetical protein